jgi:hypothetical protein
LQIFHGWPTDHLSSQNKCKAEFRNSCTYGITGKCRNSWSFLHFPELQISHLLALTLTHTFTPTHTLTPHPHPHPHTLTHPHLEVQEVQESAGIAGIARNCMFISIARFS